MINTRSGYRYDDYFTLQHADGSSVWADLRPDGLWFVWVANGREKLPVGVYDFDNALDVVLSISDSLL